MSRKIGIYSNRGQGVILVLYALRQLGGARAKQEVLEFIQANGFYEITKHDLPAYESKSEPKYHTLLCWARKDAIENDWLLDHDEHDMWHLSRKGREVLDKVLGSFREHKLKVRDCYLWSQRFKKTVDPQYTPSDKDQIRPEDRLEGLLKEL